MRRQEPTDSAAVETVDRVLDALRELGAKTADGAEVAWPILVQEQRAAAIVGSVCALAGAICGLILMAWGVRRELRLYRQDKYNTDPTGTAGAMLGLLSAAGCLVWLGSVAPKVFAPNLYLVERLLASL